MACPGVSDHVLELKQLTTSPVHVSTRMKMTPDGVRQDLRPIAHTTKNPCGLT